MGIGQTPAWRALRFLLMPEDSSTVLGIPVRRPLHHPIWCGAKCLFWHLVAIALALLIGRL